MTLLAEQKSELVHIPKDPDQKCNGKRNGQVNQYCNNVAGYGTDHVGIGRCKFHGGSAPQYAVQVEKLIAEQEVQTYGLPTEIDPHSALLGELYRTQGHVEWLHSQVAIIDPGYLTRPVGGVGGSIPDRKAHPVIELYQSERTHLRLIAKACIDAGIEDRKVRIAEQQGQLLATVIQGILTELKVLDLPDTPKVVRKYLTMATSDSEKVNSTNDA